MTLAYLVVINLVPQRAIDQNLILRMSVNQSYGALKLVAFALVFIRTAAGAKAGGTSEFVEARVS